jgi:signal transduction histidine kinase
LRAFDRLAALVAESPFDDNEIVERASEGLRESFGLSRVRWRSPGHSPLLDPTVELRGAALLDDGTVVVPLVVKADSFGFLVGDRPGEELELDGDDLALLTALGRLVAGFMARARDYRQLERTRGELARVDRARSDFVSLASHELRTPIAVVHGIAATLHHRKLSSEREEELHRILFEHTGRLSGLTEQLLDLSRVDADRLPLHPERFRPRQRVEELLPRIAADRRDDVVVRGDQALEVVTDAIAFERIASNLILNALHHGAPPVDVRTSVNGGLVLVVEDRGDGVPAEFTPQLFDRFTRSDTTRRRGPGGAGLGLAIASAFATAIGGGLRYEPASPRGARFTAVIPVDA